MVDQDRSVSLHRAGRSLTGVVTPLFFVLALASSCATAVEEQVEEQNGEQLDIDFQAIDLDGRPFEGR